MKLVYIILLILFKIKISYSKKQESSTLIELTDNNFQSFFTEHPYDIILTLFYAPWCYWSRLMMIEYEAAAKISETQYKEVIFTRVDASNELIFAEMEGIKAYPTLKMYINSQVEVYNGHRQRADLIYWLETVSNRNKNITTQEQLDSLIANIHQDYLVVLGSFDSISPNSAYKLAAKSLGNTVLFGEIDNDELISYLSQTYLIKKNQLKKPFIIALSAFNKEEKHIEDKYIEDKHTEDTDIADKLLEVEFFKGNFNDSTEIEKFVKVQRFPHIVPLNDMWTSSVFSDGRPILLLIVSPLENASNKAMKKLLKEFASKYRSRIIFSYTQGEKRLQKRLLTELAAEEEDLPLIRIIQQPGLHGHSSQFLKYKPADNDLQSFNLDTFLETFLDGKLKPYVKSEIPLDEDMQSNDHVKTLVGDNFDSIARNPNLDVFVMFHAPWCGHCRELMPIFAECARLLKPVKSIVIARIDATLNEVFNIILKGYPTMMLFPASVNESHIVYNGGWTVPAMIHWLSRTSKMAKFDTEQVLQGLDPNVREIVGDEL